MNKPTTKAGAEAYSRYTNHKGGVWKTPRGHSSNRAMRSRRALKADFARAERRANRVDVVAALEEYRCVGCGSTSCSDTWCESQYTSIDFYVKWERGLVDWGASSDFEPEVCDCPMCNERAFMEAHEPYDSDPYGDAYNDEGPGDYDDRELFFLSFYD